MKSARLAVLFLVVAIPQLLRAVASADTRQGAYRASIAQETVRNDAATVKADLAVIIAEAKLNGISADDAEALRPILKQLGALTEAEMQTVIDSLKSAGLSSDEALQKREITEASQSQQSIATPLYSLAGNLGVRLAKEALPRDLRDLLGRQLANLRLTMRLQLLPAAGNESGRQMIAANQQAIADGVTALLQNMDNLATTLTGVEAEPFKAALALVQKEHLAESASAAARTASESDLTGTLRYQSRVRDILLAASQTLVAKQSASEQLVQMSEALERLIADQTELNSATRIQGVDTTLLASRETSLADQTGVLRSLNPKLLPAVTTSLEAARLAMQAAASSLGTGDTGATTRTAQDNALDALRSARAQLAERMKTEQQSLAAAAESLSQAREQLSQAQQNLRQENTSAADPQLAAANDAAQQAARQAGLPETAKQALAAAQAALASSQAAAAQGDTPKAQQAAAQAAKELAAAQAAVAQAQSTLGQQDSAQEPAAPDPNAPEKKGPPGISRDAAPPTGADSGSSKATGENNQPANRTGATGAAQVVTGLRPRDRDAIIQAQADKTPPEFTPLVRQYLKNLAEGTTP
jgi:hypothetical protein